MTLPTIIPKELGLPDKYTSWRRDQAESVEEIVKARNDFFLLDAPTGSGKSLVAVASYKRMTVMDQVLARMTDDAVKFRCIYLTKTIQLQEQLLGDFPEAKVMKGRSNYPCPSLITSGKTDKITAADCPGKDCLDECPYKRAKYLATMSPLAVLNDDYYLAEVNGPGGFKGANMVVVDEVDSLESSLMEFIKFTISERQVNRFDLKLPDDIESISAWLGWIDQARRQVRGVVTELDHSLPDPNVYPWTKRDIDTNREIKQAESFMHSMDMFTAEASEEWIMDTETGTRAGSVGPYTEKYLWNHGSRFLCMSGTILDPEILADDLGISAYDYRQLECQFPVENRLIHFKPVANLKWQVMDQELPKLIPEITDILERHTGENVLIHTTSGRIRDFLANNLPYADRIMTHDTADRAAKLLEFKKARGKVMISPSFDRGVDLPDDECRVVIIVKTPYMALGDKQVKARLAMPKGQRWYNLRAIQTVMQMTGRAVRNERDFCEVHILDRQFDSLLGRTRHLLPKWWLEALRRD